MHEKLRLILDYIFFPNLALGLVKNNFFNNDMIIDGTSLLRVNLFHQ